MANIVVSLGSFNDESVTATYTYNDVTHIITALTITNNGVIGTMSVTVTSLNGSTVIFQGSRAFNTGTLSRAVNIPMTEVTGINPKNGQPFDVFVAPFNAALQWTSV